MLTSMKPVIELAYKEKFAVGQFNIHNIEWITAVLNAAKKQKSAVILGVSSGSIPQMGGFKTIVSIVTHLIDYLEITTPVVIHLDHGKSVKICKEAIDAGFTSVMFDGSHLPFKENLKLSLEVINYAKSKDVSVELELGTIAGSEDGIVNSNVIYADLKECEEIAKLKPTAFAPALGSTHGLYRGKAKIGFAEMEEISLATKIPLVLHGGTGISDKDILRAISLGTAKVNVNTEFMYEWCLTVKQLFENTTTDINDPRKVINIGCNAVSKAIEDKIMLLGSNNRY
ncbi:ketose-bisphosphate aldolase [Psychromonas sp. SA13A]|uniref:ketose-bisphosphate aldolase n=1 Tax=Psychromonas sp. SA13A TaxID=2686346 RepID=UPI00140CC5B8|nr:ketose-bisphosphate aldolase [Psychromonas sp. SA13A]